MLGCHADVDAKMRSEKLKLKREWCKIYYDSLCFVLFDLFVRRLTQSEIVKEMRNRTQW